MHGGLSVKPVVCLRVQAVVLLRIQSVVRVEVLVRIKLTGNGTVRLRRIRLRPLSYQSM